MNNRQINTLTEAIAAALLLIGMAAFYFTIAFIVLHFVIKFW
jgi:hypothetical protein